MKRYAISVTTDKQFLSAYKNVDRLDEAIDYAKELASQCLLSASEDSVINISITKQFIKE